ncbi:hypothetical protein CR513_08391, partial [Mucuna pruriens]
MTVGTTSVTFTHVRIDLTILYHMIQTQFDKGIKRLCFGSGKEYVNHGLSSFHSKQGIIHEFTCFDTQQQNGVSKGKIIPSCVLGNTNFIQPIISLFPSNQIMQNLVSRVFRCVAFVHVYQQHRTKLDPQAVRCIFLGYSPIKGYKCYHPSSHRYFVSMDVNFREYVSFFTRPQLQGRIIIWNMSSSFSSLSLVSILAPPLPIVLQESTPSTLVLEAANMGKPILMYERKEKPNMVKKQLQLSKLENFIIAFDYVRISELVQEALKDEKWVKVMDEEMKALERNGT